MLPSRGVYDARIRSNDFECETIAAMECGAESNPMTKPFLENAGICPTCDSETIFRSESPSLRDFYACLTCGSLPRERALMRVIDTVIPNYAELRIHESSPARPARGASRKLSERCSLYVESQFDPSIAPGSEHVDGYRCEDLESLAFANESIDVHVTQDVLEHVLDPARAFAEIARTLAPGGVHVFTVPLVRARDSTQIRARRNAHGEVEFLEPPDYHQSAVGDEGALVTRCWGYDIVDFIYETSGMITTIWSLDDLSSGIRAEFNEVLVSRRLS